MYEKFLPIVQTMIDSFKLNTSGLSSMENLDSTTGLDNDSSITDSMPLDDAIPFLDEQPSLPFSSSSSSAMDFQLFMDSFANSIFNGTSIFGGVGTSMVNGVKVSGISSDNNGSRLSVTLSGTPTQMLGRYNTTSTTNNTTSTTTTNAESLNSVSVIAMRIPINLADILSPAQASSSQGLDNDMMTEDRDFNEDSIFPSDSFNPFSLLSSMQIGSSSLTNADWSVPQTVTMDLVGGNNNQEQQQQQSYSTNNTSAADLLFVSVIPYTGSDNNNISP